ncbi:Lar family restriction alleviation protein [Vibrio vulnificus]|nr:Lar family restriction alleviation protein [Vibrio vulnificus]
MKAAITKCNHYVPVRGEPQDKTIETGSIVIIRHQGKPDSDSLVSHKFCGGFHVWNKYLDVIEGNLLEVDWLNNCPKCGCKTSYVETKSKKNTWLYEGDVVHCAECNKKGLIEAIEQSVVEVVWEELDDRQHALEALRDAIQNAEQFGLVRTDDGKVITGANDSGQGFVLVEE